MFKINNFSHTLTGYCYISILHAQFLKVNEDSKKLQASKITSLVPSVYSMGIST